jgi:hypothetical protein
VSFAGLLDTTVTVERETVTQTRTGQTARSWAPVATGVPCSIQQASGQRVTREQGVRVEAGWRGYFLPGADVALGDHVVDGARIYQVVLIEDIRGHHLEAALRQWTG